MEHNFKIWQTTKEAFGFVNHHLEGWLKVASAPFLVMLAVIFFVIMMGGASVYAVNGGLHMTAFNVGALTFTIAFIGSVISQLMLTVNAYRFAMYREGGTKWFEFRFDNYMVKVLLFYIAVILIYVGLGALVGGIVTLAAVSGLYIFAWILGALLLCALGYLGVRLIFVILFAASGIENPIRSSFDYSKGRVLKLLGIMIVLGILLALLSFGVMFVFGLIGGLLGATQIIILQLLAACLIFTAEALVGLYTHVVVMSAFVLVYNKIAK